MKEFLKKLKIKKEKRKKSIILEIFNFINNEGATIFLDKNLMVIDSKINSLKFKQIEKPLILNMRLRTTEKLTDFIIKKIKKI